MESFTDIESQVEYGLEKVNPNRKIEVPLQNFLYLHNTIWEFIRFFRSPGHYQSLEDIELFLGNNEKGAYHLLCEILYNKFQYDNIFPKDIKEMIENGEFNNPKFPYYYKSE